MAVVASVDASAAVGIHKLPVQFVFVMLPGMRVSPIACVRRSVWALAAVVPIEASINAIESIALAVYLCSLQ